MEDYGDRIGQCNLDHSVGIVYKGFGISSPLTLQVGAVTEGPIAELDHGD